MKTASAKAKGRKLQQYVRDEIYRTWPHLSEGDVDSTSMGASGVDVLLSPAAREACPVSFECKATRATPSIAQVKQATANKYKDTIPVVAWKPHGKTYKDTLVMCKLEDLLIFLQDRIQ